KLLTAFGSVCLAIDFAHARGVIHRDLKPGNIMLGGFGEVYVLDWGVAKLGNVPEPQMENLVHAPLTEGGGTAVGAVMGTPGYMPPEQMLGGELDARSDVYALGAILFEILTLHPLHPQSKVQEVIASTLKGADTSLARETEREIPPELEAICARATTTLPDDRFASARELNVAIERFLDGDRDLERRQIMAAMHADIAMAAAERALADLKGGDESRRDAMRELGRSLALDAGNADALRTMVRLIAEPPDDVPPEAQIEIDEAKAEGVKVQARAAAWAYASWFLYFPLIVLMGIIDWFPTIAAGTFMLIAIGLTIASGRSRGSPLTFAFGGLICASLASAFTSRMFGPFILVPTIVLATVIGFSMHNERRHRVVAVIFGLVGIVGPAVLEWAQLIPRSYAFRDEVMIVLPHTLRLHEGPTLTFLLVGNVMAVVTTLMYVGWTRDQLARMQRRALIQSWHFRQLAPDDARAALKRPTVPPSGCAVTAA
ncbi:MAG: serine/threonine-protein kinase, partial [Polyangiaceae bacterium]